MGWGGRKQAGRTKRATPEEVVDALIGMRITQVAAHPRDGALVVVKSGRRTLASLDIVRAHRLGVRVGVEIGVELAEALAQGAMDARVRGMALRRLERSACSTAGLVRGLVRKGVGEEAARAVAGDLTRAGLLDDAAFAASKARSILARKPAGARLIEAKLRVAGVAGELAKRAAREALRGRDALEDAVALVRRRAQRLPARLDACARKRRLLGMLVRRGFEGDVARRAVEVVGGNGVCGTGSGSNGRAFD